MKTAFRRNLLLVPLIGLLSSCATPQRNYRPEVTEISWPALNTETVAQVGEEMLRQGKYYEGDGIRLAEEMKFGGLITAYRMSAGEYAKEGEDKESEFYQPSSGPKGGSIQKGALIDPWKSIQYQKDGSKIAIVTIFHAKVSEKAKGVARIKIPLLAEDSFQQTLIYSGKLGQKIKVGYREFSNNVARPAFHNDVEYDLGESKVVGYKGARIEILEATNELIRYRVLQNFNRAER
jgi:hypothetical protein